MLSLGSVALADRRRAPARSPSLGRRGRRPAVRSLAASACHRRARRAPVPAQHRRRLDAGQRPSGGPEAPEAEHRPRSALGAAVALPDGRTCLQSSAAVLAIGRVFCSHQRSWPLLNRPPEVEQGSGRDQAGSRCDCALAARPTKMIVAERPSAFSCAVTGRPCRHAAPPEGEAGPGAHGRASSG